MSPEQHQSLSTLLHLLSDRITEVRADMQDHREESREAMSKIEEKIDALHARDEDLDAKVDKLLLDQAEKRGEDRAKAGKMVAAGGLAGVSVAGIVEAIKAIMAGMGKG